MKASRKPRSQVGDLPVKVAIAHGLANARKMMDEIKAGKSHYHFIEIMCCPGGCIGGGGQPIPTNWEIRKKRIEAIYEEDSRLPMRKSHENPFIDKVYEEFLKEPLGHNRTICSTPSTRSAPSDAFRPLHGRAPREAGRFLLVFVELRESSMRGINHPSLLAYPAASCGEWLAGGFSRLSGPRRRRPQNPKGGRFYLSLFPFSLFPRRVHFCLLSLPAIWYKNSGISFFGG